MKFESLAHLACPACRGSLTLRSAEAAGTDQVERGELRCADCQRSYPIVAGIPRFPIPNDSDCHKTLVRTQQTYNFTWTRFGAREIQEGWEKDSYTYTKLIPERIFEGAGKIGLDAGCGGGADLRRFWKQGIRIIGLDLSAGVDTIARMGDIPSHGDLVQGDLQRMPFKPGTFDFIYSFGVLHHLPNPEEGFVALSEGLKPGAALITYLYELFDDRPQVARSILWGIRQIRRVSAWIPPRMLYGCCWLLVPFVWAVFAVPARILSLLGVQKAARLPFSHTIRWPVLAADLYDRFAPPVEHRLSEKQVRELYARCGLERVEVRRYHGWVSWGYKPDTVREYRTT
jgi:SAM-dependent methyltransferase/uncharacterized protein YbaR (Trm112 family)